MRHSLQVFLCLFIVVSLNPLSIQGQEGEKKTKNVLVVSATTGFRHASIPNGEKMLVQLAEKSQGEFRMTLMSADPAYPNYSLANSKDPNQQERFQKDLAAVFEKYMSPSKLADYQGVFFVSTTGKPPIPNMDAFLDWVREGHAVMGLHAATDHQLSEPFAEMLGGGARFESHPGGGNIARRIVQVDKDHPVSKDWMNGLPVVDEFYRFKNFDRNKVHSLLDLQWEEKGKIDLYPVSWIKDHGNGRIFYTSMGHRDDVMLPDLPSIDYGSKKENGNEVSAAYQHHVTQGIRWALRLIP